MTWWMWILIGLVAIGAELVIPGGVVLAFFGAVALLVGVLSALGLGGPLWFQWLLFSSLSLISLVTLRKPILRWMAQGPKPSDLDSLVGQEVHLTEPLAAGAEGKVELRGTSWTARNVGSQDLDMGTTGVLVESTDGLKLKVRRS